jgi:CRP/FNR family transcriptional regulator, nitrogen oxide reductase regulator
MLTTTKSIPAAFPAVPKDPLSTMDLFKCLPFKARVEAERGMVERKYAKGESLFLEDDPADSIWLVKEGYVKEILHLEDGRRSTLCIVGPNGMFGISAFEGGEYGLHGVAETDATVFSFPVGFFQSLMERHPQLARAVVSQISKLLHLSREMQSFSQRTAEKRLLHVLLEMAGKFGDTIPLTRKELAEMAGTAVETCIRVFTRLEKAGLIESAHGRLAVRDREGLRERMEGT